MVRAVLVRCMKLNLSWHLTFQLSIRGIKPIWKLKDTFLDRISFHIMLRCELIRITEKFSAELEAAGEVIQVVTNESIQMFGGIGMTDDEEIGFFMKRARVAQQTFGDYNYHLDRFASLNGF